jgi:hypothetical protein
MATLIIVRSLSHQILLQPSNFSVVQRLRNGIDVENGALPVIVLENSEIVGLQSQHVLIAAVGGSRVARPGGEVETLLYRGGCWVGRVPVRVEVIDKVEPVIWRISGSEPSMPENEMWTLPVSNHLLAKLRQRRSGVSSRVGSEDEADVRTVVHCVGTADVVQYSWLTRRELCEKVLPPAGELVFRFCSNW